MRALRNGAPFAVRAALLEETTAACLEGASASARRIADGAPNERRAQAKPRAVLRGRAMYASRVSRRPFGHVASCARIARMTMRQRA